ncbi:kelch repeat-containing protein [Chengkuizengella sediminis]|uniref:Kelch repeat-containing protein n=1 Tax=Chengkuizengella sediminis TaxID=1885917 RepID=UPI00138A12C2|nr:kelch repeat-containing protein [Chengkuizengella sediminis]NDI36498.1 hypothetical protein [Chengkuizengella sediminis]
MLIRHEKSSRLIALVIVLLFVFSSVKVYAEENTWTEVGSMNFSKKYSQIEVLDGKIYSVGGYNAAAIANVEVYDSETNVWTEVASMHTLRYNHQTVIMNGKIYAIGGLNNLLSGTDRYLSKVEVYDPETDIWTQLLDLNYQRQGHQAVVLNNQIYAIGGHDGTNYSSSVEVYDYISDRWNQLASMNYARTFFQTEIIDGKIYVIGGYGLDTNRGSGYYPLANVEVYDPETNTWTELESMEATRSYFSTEVIDGKIYAIGGRGDQAGGTENLPLSSVEVYNPETNTWTNVANMERERRYFKTEVMNGKIYAISGQDQVGTLNSVEEYDPSTNTWKYVSNINTGRIYFESQVIDGKIFVFGGVDSNNNLLNSVEVYTPISIPNMPINLIASSNDSQVSLTWNEVENTDSYIVKRAFTSGGPYEIIAENVTETSYIDVTVENDVTYYYVVSSVNVDIESENSIEAAATPKLPTTSSNLILMAGDAEVNLTWSAVENATNYIVKRSLTSEGPYNVIAENITETSYLDLTVENGVTYYYVILSVNNLEEIGNSNEASATPGSSGTSLANLTARAEDSRVYLSWEAIEGVESYTIKRSTTSGGPYFTIAENITSTSYIDGNLINGTPYYYVVVTVDETVESENSNEVLVIPEAPNLNARGILYITFVNGQEKEYDLSMAEIQDFIVWYGNSASGTASPLYTFDKNYNVGPFVSRTDYIILDKIMTFEISEYTQLQ